MSDVPPELISDVFTRLPVKSLLRFRCVCKSWKALIDSPDFIQAHLKRQQLVKPNSDFKLILQGSAFHSIDFTSVCSGRNSKPQELDHGPAFLLGSCNGLLLIAESPTDMALWNPSTKIFRKLPACLFGPSEPRCLPQFVVGFGYDGSSDDYKVVGIDNWFLGDSVVVSRTLIYNLKLNMWKKVDQECPHLLQGKSSTLAGGVLHWIPSESPTPATHFIGQRPFTLIGFNLGSERFQEVPCPENLGDQVQLKLAVLGKCLCLVSRHLKSHPNGMNLTLDVLDHVNIWVMKDYGVKESWIKLFSIEQEQLYGLQYFSNLKPITYSENGREVLLMDNSKLLWYSLETKSLKPVKISGGLKFSESDVCLGTLVPLYDGSNGNYRKTNVEPDEQTRAQNSDKGDDFQMKGFKLRL